MPVRYIKWLERDFIRANSKAKFVFGDNIERVGFGGQAAAARGEPNSIGVFYTLVDGKPVEVA